MKLLVDNQLPEALARFLDAHGLAAEQVRDHDMQTATDQEIWQYARESDLVIVTKDEDFPQLVDRYGSPPRVVWVRLGNCRTPALLAAFDGVLPDLRAMLEGDAQVVEIR